MQFKVQRFSTVTGKTAGLLQTLLADGVHARQIILKTSLRFKISPILQVKSITEIRKRWAFAKIPNPNVILCSIWTGKAHNVKICGHLKYTF